MSTLGDHKKGQPTSTICLVADSASVFPFRSGLRWGRRQVMAVALGMAMPSAWLLDFCPGDAILLR